MRIDGKKIAEKIFSELANQVKKLSIKPTLGVILVGDDPASLVYIKQKQIASERIGAKVLLSNKLSDVEKFNKDSSVHGVIIQRPLPESINAPMITINKDVDGFEPNSPFSVPVAVAVEEILNSTGVAWKNKQIVVIGRGETAGKPLYRHFKNLNIKQIHAQTENPEKFIKNADVVVSCVGKERVVTDIKQGAILIGVGIWRDNEGKLRGDYNEDEIKNVAGFYTPTPGGVGPVNVACLMKNLVKSCII